MNAKSYWEWKSRRATWKHDAGAPVETNTNWHEYDTTSTSCHTSTGTQPKLNAAATATRKAADATATELWVWYEIATAIWWHVSAGAKHVANVQHGTDGRATFFSDGQWQSVLV